ncbi:hypothetical protein H0V99_00740 [Candidatus Saccharibacteria bacterium]|nr:hypothetical protein [Candidatus Saccharibacteria bacterium]
MFKLKLIQKLKRVGQRRKSQLRRIIMGKNWRQAAVRFGCLVVVGVLLFSFILKPPKTQAEILSQGPNSASATGDCTNDTGIGTLAWTSPGNAFSDNTTYATRTVDGTTSNYIKCVNYGFSVPSSATIVGVIVGVERSSDSTGNGGSNDAAMRLVKGGTIGTVDRATTTIYTTGDVSEDHGSTTDLWGVTLSASDVNGSTFGAAFAATKPNAAGPAHTISVDHIRITVYYENHSKISTTGYIWENDDEDQAYGDVFDENSQQAAGNTSITSVEQGERMTLRMQIKNTGNSSVNSNLGLFYDRNDGIWSKVRQVTTATTSAGSGCAINTWICTSIDTSNDVGQYSSIAIDPSGNPWISYYEAASTSCDDSPTTECSLRVARYLGGATTGTGCAVNTWDCTTIDNPISTFNLGLYTSIAINAEGNPYVSYQDNSQGDLRFAYYLGGATTGTGCAVNTWSCQSIDTANSVGRYTSIAFDSSGNPWISYVDGSPNFKTRIARYHGGTSGTGCAITAWTCTTIAGGNIGVYTSINFDPVGNAWVSFYTNSVLRTAQYLAGATTGTGCDVTTWTCTTVDSGTDNGEYSSLAFDPAGNPWVSYRDANNLNLQVAHYLGGATTGTGCDVNTWTCTDVDTANNVGDFTSIAIDPSGNPWVSYYDAGSNLNLRVARYLGGATNGTGCAVNTWTCAALDTTDDVGKYSSIAFDNRGQPWISYYDLTGGNLRVAQIARKGEITMSASQAAQGGNNINESHTDMSSVSDTTNRDDADCSGGGTWNNGRAAIGEEISNLGLPDGSSTAQCTEIAFVIDTSQAVSGTTYRFVVSTKDGWRSDKGIWRGAISNDQYPTLTIESSTTKRFTKDIHPKMTDCTDTSWGCELLSTTGWSNDTSIAIDADGNPWMALYDSTNTSLRVSRYLGGATTGTGCTTNTWTCTEVVATGNVGGYPSIAIAPDGNPWISYYDDSSFELKLAQYLGGATTGTGCDVNTWRCTVIDTTGTVGDHSYLVFNNRGMAWISYYSGGSSHDLKVARYVGSGGTGCALTSWTCQNIDTSNQVGLYTAIALDANGNPWISYHETALTSCDNSPTTECSLKVAQYLGGATSGTGCAVNTWTCTIIDNPTGTGDFGDTTSITIDASDKVWISYLDVVGGYAKVAEYLNGATTGTGCAINTWTCYNVGTLGGGRPRIALDITGTPWLAYYRAGTDFDVYVARYLNGATTGTGCEVNTWSCSVLFTTGSSGNGTSIAFDRSGAPWVGFRNNSNGNLWIARMHLPPKNLRASPVNNYSNPNASRSDGRYHLTSGYSPRSTSTCAGVSDFLGLCGVAADDSNFDSITATNGRPMFTFALKNNSPASIPTITWIGRSNIAPNTATTTGDIVMEVYNFTTKTWDNLATDSASSNCSTADCTISAAVNNAQQQIYYEAIGTDFWLNVRVWQYENTSAETLKTDYFGVTFENTGSQIRHGTRFLNGLESGFDL